jgi:hypothetical protein
VAATTEVWGKVARVWALGSQPGFKGEEERRAGASAPRPRPRWPTGGSRGGVAAPAAQSVGEQSREKERGEDDVWGRREKKRFKFHIQN